LKKSRNQATSNVDAGKPTNTVPAESKPGNSSSEESGEIADKEDYQIDHDAGTKNLSAEAKDDVHTHLKSAVDEESSVTQQLK